MKPSDIIFPAAAQPANVPVCIGKKLDPTVRPTAHGLLAKFRRVSFRQDRNLQPFWTWFIDNPHPSSLK
jgi:hypothetical protein